jgi:hypothetical protein
MVAVSASSCPMPDIFDHISNRSSCPKIFGAHLRICLEISLEHSLSSEHAGTLQVPSTTSSMDQAVKAIESWGLGAKVTDRFFAQLCDGSEISPKDRFGTAMFAGSWRDPQRRSWEASRCWIIGIGAFAAVEPSITLRLLVDSHLLNNYAVSFCAIFGKNME